MWRAADLASLAALRSFRKKHFWFVEALRVGGAQAPWAEGHVRLRVARARLLEDSFGQLMSLRPRQIRLWLRVQFADEPGVDAGGLEREWFLCIAQALTDAALGLFVLEPTGYGINPAALHAFGAGTAKGRRLALQHYYFAGRVFGKVGRLVGGLWLSFVRAWFVFISTDVFPTHTHAPTAAGLNGAPDAAGATVAAPAEAAAGRAAGPSGPGGGGPYLAPLAALDAARGAAR
jgi:hypothetical protein